MKEKQKRKTFAITGLLILFSGIYWFGYNTGKPAKQTEHTDTDSLNTKLPPNQSPSAPLTKMEIYIAAEKDSLAKQQQRSRDPYVSNRKKSAAGLPHISETLHHMDQMYGELDKTLNRNLQKTVAPKSEMEMDGSQINEPVLASQTPASRQTDPELQQLAGMLDQLTALQNPSRAVRPKKIDSSFNVKAVDEKTIQAVVHQDQVVTSGGLLKLRLLTDITVNEVLIRRGTFVYGICQVNNERLMVQLNSISYNDRVLPFNLAVYDLDGLEGIYTPGAISRETGKEGVDNALQSLQLNGLDQGISAQAAGVGLQTVKTLLSRKVRTLRVTAKAGHRVFLQKNS